MKRFSALKLYDLLVTSVIFLKCMYMHVNYYTITLCSVQYYTLCVFTNIAVYNTQELKHHQYLLYNMLDAIDDMYASAIVGIGQVIISVK